MKIVDIIKMLTLTLLVISPARALEYSGDGSAKYAQPPFSEGFSFPIEFKWKSYTLFSEPVEISKVKWQLPWVFGDKIKVTFKPYGYTNLVTESVPIDIISESSIYDLSITGELKETGFLGESLGYITFNPGALSRLDDWSFNTPGSPSWEKFIHRHVLLDAQTLQLVDSEEIRYFSAEQAKSIYKNDFRLTNFQVHSVKFNLSGVKKWYYEKNLKQRVGTLAAGIDILLDIIERDPAKKHLALRQHVKQLANLNPRESVSALNNIFYNITSKNPPKGFEIKKEMKLLFSMSVLQIHGALNPLYALNGKVEDANYFENQELDLIFNNKQNILERVNARSEPSKPQPQVFQCEKRMYEKYPNENTTYTWSVQYYKYKSKTAYEQQEFEEWALATDIKKIRKKLALSADRDCSNPLLPDVSVISAEKYSRPKGCKYDGPCYFFRLKFQYSFKK